MHRLLEMNRKFFSFLLAIICNQILCRVLPEERVEVIIPDNLTPQKEAIFFQRTFILLVPTALGGLGGVGGLPIGAGIGGLPYGVLY